MRRAGILAGLWLAAVGARAEAATILDLQPYRSGEALAPAAPGLAQATLVNLNPRINAWHLLVLDGPGGRQSYHLENPRPAQGLHLDPAGLRLGEGGAASLCALWPAGAPSPLQQAMTSGTPYAPLCGGRLYLRNAVAGRYTWLERTTNFLRDHVWGGDRIVSFVRDQFYRDAFVENAAPAAAGAGPAAVLGPPPARLAAGAAGAIALTDVGIDLGRGVNSVQLGQWYPVAGAAGVYFSAAQPRAVDPAVAAALRGRVEGLDGVEAAALDFIVGFDLAQFELGFMLGTDHPRLDWSERPPAAMRVPGLPGPDGIGSSAPLVRTGMLGPAAAARAVAAFTGGFKREHGAFRYGALALRNRGSHYGFIEQGTVFSRLQPGLATLYVLDDGTVGMKTWDGADDALLPRIRHARQNGVPLIDQDPQSGTPQPASLVTQWGPGNWSGSEDRQQRTLRAGACLVQAGERRFLLYGYFSAATPRAMARVFQAYGCGYAMHLDMNALEHTYLAIYTHRAGQLVVQHLVQGMAVVDGKGGGDGAARFLSFPDDRDFFFLLKRGDAP